MLISDDNNNNLFDQKLVSGYRANSITATDRKKDEPTAYSASVPLKHPPSSSGVSTLLKQEEIESSYGLTNIQKPLLHQHQII